MSELFFKLAATSAAMMAIVILYSSWNGLREKGVVDAFISLLCSSALIFIVLAMWMY